CARRILAVPQAGKEILAGPDRGGIRALRSADRLLAVERGRAVHLHAVLGAHPDPRYLRVLPRLGGLSGPGRPHRRGRAAGALYAEEARCRLSVARRRLLSPRSGRDDGEARPGGLLREAAGEIQPADRDLHRRRAAGPALVSDGAAAVADREALDVRRPPQPSRRL